MAARIVSVIGHKNAGKTTLTVALAGELTRRGRRVMTIKHGHHAAPLDTRGTDSWRHFYEGRAERTLLVGPEVLALFARCKDAYDPIALARRYLDDADIVLVEGYKRAPLPKIEVFRRAVAPQPIHDPAAPDGDRWIALISDVRDVPARCPVLHFEDTAWLQTLTTIAWERAQPL